MNSNTAPTMISRHSYETPLVQCYAVICEQGFASSLTVTIPDGEDDGFEDTDDGM